MSYLKSRFSSFSTQISLLLFSALILVTSCRPEGFINKVKYQGEKYINTCESFTADVNQLIQRNNRPGVLKVSEYDNSDLLITTWSKVSLRSCVIH
jgi:hypothetical protein